MLTQVEVTARWYKHSKYEIFPASTKTSSDDYAEWFILLGANDRVAGLAKHPAAVVAVSGFEYQEGKGFFHPNMGHNYPSFQFDPRKPWLIQLGMDGGGWSQNYNFTDVEELDSFILNAWKVNALDDLMRRIDYSRLINYAYFNDVQGRIYQSKVAEAKEIVANGVEQDSTMQYPFITGYAHTAGIDLQEAAKRVLIKNLINEAGLAETENFRMKAQSLFRNAQTTKELHEHYLGMMVELSKYGAL